MSIAGAWCLYEGTEEQSFLVIKPEQATPVGKAKTATSTQYGLAIVWNGVERCSGTGSFAEYLCDPSSWIEEIPFHITRGQGTAAKRTRNNRH
ncbi:MAG: hypothetical protein NTW21_30580 [Verrucomicrobia bacterium]|nr:hypothetical protein [Verrucomicrobiota bacterium]